VVSFRGGRGIVDDRHKLGLTIPAGYRLWPETDLLLAFGTRLDVPMARWGAIPTGLKIARIDLDPAEMRRLKVDIGIVADTADAARMLAQAVAPRADAARADKIARAKTDTAAAIQKVQPQMSYLAAIRDVLPEDGIFCDEMTQVGYVSWFGFPFHAPRTLITSGFSGTLGAGFPMALGVKVAQPDRAVVAVTGDGGFLFGGAELATAVQHGINLVTVLFNNSAYGNVLRDQRRMFEGRDSGSVLRNPDFQTYARSFGVPSWRVTDPDGLRVALREALAANSPALIEVMTDITKEAQPWEFIAPGRG
jgi:acetolactate synthase I/II/III large subunit